MNLLQYSFNNIFGMIVLVLVTGNSGLFAQYEVRWLNIGSFQSPYNEGGAMREYEVGEGSEALNAYYPAMAYHSGNGTARALWVGVKNFTDEKGNLFNYKMSTLGPRATGNVTVFPQSIEVISRFPDPDIRVDGAQTFLRYVFIDKVDAKLKADRRIKVINNNNLGIRMERNIYAFSQQFHDNYHVNEYIFTNTGNTDDDPDIELNKTLHDVYFYFINRNCMAWGASISTGGAQSWGKYTMNDAVGDGYENYDVDFTAQYSWVGWDPNISGFNIIGLPLMLESYLFAGTPELVDGRLMGAQMVGSVYLHADKSPNDKTNDDDQPRTMNVVDSDDADLVTDEFDQDLMQRQYENFLAAGRLYPHHAQVIVPSKNYALQNSPANSFNGVTTEGGWGYAEGYGPYELKPGESIRLVQVEGAGGLSNDAKIKIGQVYKNSGDIPDEFLPIEYNVETKTKNEWALTAKDSLFKTFERAIANYKSGYEIPHEPLPPSKFYINSSDDKIELEWDVFPEAKQTGFEIYRSESYYNAEEIYELIATLDASEHSYEDRTPKRGIDYYYYIVAVGEINNNNTGMTPTGVILKSNREYTRTYSPARLKRPRGSLAKGHIVPNPFNIASDPNIRYPDQQDKLGFLDIPGQCTIKIYTQLGNLVETIEHTDGSGDEFWNLTTYSKQLIASGIYIAVIEDKETGDSEVKKFVVIR